jgi:hypothetical protein
MEPLVTDDIEITETQKAHLDAGRTVYTDAHMLQRAGWRMPADQVYDMGEGRIVVVPDPDTLDIPIEGLTERSRP